MQRLFLSEICLFGFIFLHYHIRVAALLRLVISNFLTNQSVLAGCYMLSQPSTLKYQAMSCICFKSIILPFETETLLCAAITEEGNTASPLSCLCLAVCIIPPPAAAAGTSFLLHLIPGGISTGTVTVCIPIIPSYSCSIIMVLVAAHMVSSPYIYTDDGTAI